MKTEPSDSRAYRRCAANDKPLSEAENAESAQIAKTIANLYTRRKLGPNSANYWINEASSYPVAAQARDQLYGFLQAILQNPAEAASVWTQGIGRMIDDALAARNDEK